MSASHLIGIYIGTTSVKAVMIDLSGRRVAEFASAYPTHRPGPGWVEQDPEDWLRLVRAALARFSAHGDAAALCLTSQVNTHVFADRNLDVLHPAIVWQDGRAAEAGAALDRGVGFEEKIAWLGAPIPVDASHALSRMAWMRDARPDVWARTAHLLLPRDWVLARLTGALVTDPISSVGLVTPGFTYADPLIARLEGAAQRLVPLADPFAVVGHLGGDGPFAGGACGAGRDGCLGQPVRAGRGAGWRGVLSVRHVRRAGHHVRRSVPADGHRDLSGLARTSAARRADPVGGGVP